MEDETILLVDLSPSAVRQLLALAALAAVGGPVAWLATGDELFALVVATMFAAGYAASLWLGAPRSVEGNQAHSELHVRRIIGPTRSIPLGPRSHVRISTLPLFGRSVVKIGGSDGSSVTFDAGAYDPRRLLAYCENVPGLVIDTHGWPDATKYIP